MYVSWLSRPAAVLLVLFLFTGLLAQQQAAQEPEFVPGEVLIKFKDTVATTTRSQTLSSARLTVAKSYDNIGVIKCMIPSDRTVAAAVAEFEAYNDIEFAEPNYIYRTTRTPNDPRFSELWGMVMIDAPEAWDIQTGRRSVIVGVIDTGINHQHSDLADNMWKNPGESGNGKENNNVDDDNNGFIDDVYGWDFVNDDSDPLDDNDHGSHVSGTVGGVGDNNTGVVGVNWTVSLMALKFLGADGSGNSADAISAIMYATEMGAKVLNNSWGGGGRSQSLLNAIEFANSQGVLFVAAAGNAASNNDTFPSYPASYEATNIIAVAASTENDGLASFSNFGLHTVHLAAPGTNILSTTSSGGYDKFNGTSMATPHVAGAAALVWSQFQGASVDVIKTRLLGSVEYKSSFANVTMTGGRLNVNNALSTSPIIYTQRIDNTLDETGPYTFEAEAVDDGSITTAIFSYSVNGASPITENMTALGGSTYQGQIPGQALGSSVLYSVTVTDDQGNQSTGRQITFEIAQGEQPPGGGCGCGQTAADVRVGNAGLRTAVNATVNLSFFVLPFVAIGAYSRLRKRKSNKSL